MEEWVGESEGVVEGDTVPPADTVAAFPLRVEVGEEVGMEGRAVEEAQGVGESVEVEEPPPPPPPPNTEGDT